MNILHNPPTGLEGPAARLSSFPMPRMGCATQTKRTASSDPVSAAVTVGQAAQSSSPAQSRVRFGAKSIGLWLAQKITSLMKIRFPFLIATLAILALVFVGSVLGIFTPLKAFALLALGQLAMLSISRPQAALFITGLSQEQLQEFETAITRCSGFFDDYGPMLKLLKEKKGDIEALIKDVPEMKGTLQKMRKTAFGGAGNVGVRWIGNKPFVSEECATYLTARFVMDVSKLENGLDNLVKDASARELVVNHARGIVGIEQRTAMTTTEVPMPTLYVGQVVELVFAYGAARQYATVFPMGSGSVKLPRLKAGEDDFGYLGVGTAGMSQPVGEKRAAAELVSFDANKAGGLIRLPYELSVETFPGIGQFLARYIARQLAKLEDKTLFLGDGTATYANQVGVGKYCVDNATYLLKLDAGKTLVTDITLDNLRNLRGRVSPAVLANMAANAQTDAAYYFHPSLEPVLRGFNKYPNFVVFTNENGKPMFDGWPVRWIGVGATNSGIAQPEAYAAFFGDLTFWYLGEAGQVRLEVSKEVFFATDELAMRALERIDINGMAEDAMATLQLGAAA